MMVIPLIHSIECRNHFLQI